MHKWAVLAALVVGCDGGGETDPEGDADTDADSDADSDADADGDVPDPAEGLDGTDPDCEYVTLDGEDTYLPGATVFWVGDYALGSDDAITGTEHQLVFPNATWMETDDTVQDCRLTWTVEGTKGDPVGCASCDYSLSIVATFAGSNPACPGGYVMEEGIDFDVLYNVSVSGDETIFTFESGNELGRGHTDGTRVTYADEGNCAWY